MDEYVTNASWVRTVGRPDAIDDIADQFEKPAPGAEQFWTHAARRHTWVADRAEHLRAS